MSAIESAKSWSLANVLALLVIVIIVIAFLVTRRQQRTGMAFRCMNFVFGSTEWMGIRPQCRTAEPLEEAGGLHPSNCWDQMLRCKWRG